MASIYIMLCLHFASFFRLSLQKPHLPPGWRFSCGSPLSCLRQWCASWGCQAVLWGRSCGFPRTAEAPAAARPPLPRLVQPPRPALSGGGPRRAAILDGFSCRRRCSTFLPPKQGGCGCGAPVMVSAPGPSLQPSQAGKAVGAQCLRAPQGRRLTADSLAPPPPPSIPTGVAAIFPLHKMAARGPDSSPTRNWGSRESSRTLPPRPPPTPRACGGACPAPRAL